MELPEVKEEFNSFEDLMKNFTIFSGRPITSPFDAAKVYFAISTENELNYTIPNWAYDYLNNQHMLNTIAFYYKTMTYNNIMKKLTAGMQFVYKLQNILFISSELKLKI